MKIVSYEKFARMPSGTIFAPYAPYVFEEELSIKVDGGNKSEHSDGGWCFNGVCSLAPTTDNGVDFEYSIYDGAPDDYLEYEQFAIYEESDIDDLIKVLMWAKNKCKGVCNAKGLVKE